MTRRTQLASVALLALICAGCGAPSCSRTDAPSAAQAQTQAQRPSGLPRAPIVVDARGCVDGVPPLAAGVERGVCFAHSWEHGGARGYGTPTSALELDALKELGADWISVTPFGFVESLRATEVHLPRGNSGGESDERVRAEIDAAHTRGIHVLLKPHLWAHGGVWINQIDPGSEAGWARWLASYRAFLLHYAALAEETRTETLAVGVELGSTVRHEAWWRETIAQVRAVYRGKLVYCASWDRANAVHFWDALDFIGAQFYATLAASRDDTDEASMRVRLDAELVALGALSARVARPVLFTEVGYKSIRGAAHRPHEWPEAIDRAHAVADQDSQARAYRLFFAGLDGRSWVRGVYVWKWFTDPDTREEGPLGFSPRGKPAETVLRTAYRGEVCR